MSINNTSHERFLRLYVKGLSGAADRSMIFSYYTGRPGYCPLCDRQMLRPLITGHILSRACPNPRKAPIEPIILVAPNGAPEIGWEKD